MHIKVYNSGSTCCCVCRTAAASLLAACSSYASAVRILHEHYLPLLPLAAAVELTIHTSVQGSPPGRAQGSVLLHLDMSTYEYYTGAAGAAVPIELYRTSPPW